MDVPFLKYDDEDGGESENDSTCIGDDAVLRDIRRRPTQKRFLVSLLLNALLLVLVVTGYAVSRANPKANKLLPTPVPEFSQEIRTFKMDPLFLSLPTEESTAAWEALPGPNGWGFINLEQPSDFGFPDKKAGLSVFHQLHCLGALRKFMWELLYNKVDTEALLKTWPANATSPTYEQAINGVWHYAHCFDYLRQGLQCSGDMSLEFVNQHTGRAVVDGLDYPHQCVSWAEIWSYAERYN